MSERAVVRPIRASINLDGPGFDGGGGGGDDGGMEARIAKLESIAEKTGERLGAIERDLAVMRTEMKTFATKEDLARVEGGLQTRIAESQNRVIMWVVSSIFLAQLLPALLKKLGL